MAKTITMLPAKIVCPECQFAESIHIGVSRGFSFDADKYYVKDDKGTNEVHAESLIKCSSCKAEFYYRMKLIPSFTVYKMTETTEVESVVEEVGT